MKYTVWVEIESYDPETDKYENVDAWPQDFETLEEAIAFVDELLEAK